MKSTVESYVSFEEIQVPKKYLQIKIPSWDEVVQPTFDMLKEHISPSSSQTVELTDELIKGLKIAEFNSLVDVRKQAITIFQKNQIQRQYDMVLFPYLLVYFAETSQTIVNEEEFEAFLISYQASLTKEFENQVEGQNLSMADENLRQQAREAFIFKLIAQHRFKMAGLDNSEEAYEDFIRLNVLNQLVDEIELRQKLSYNQFKDLLPEIRFNEALFAYFQPKFQFIITD